MTRDEAHAILRTSEQSSAAHIKFSYRTLAQEWHPDRNKAPEAEARFKEIKAAYELLTGEPEPDNARVQMLERLSGLFLAAVEGLPPDGDPVAAVKHACLRVQQDLRANIAETAAAIRKRERVLSRLRSKKPEATVLQDFLRRDIERHKASMKSLEEEIPKAQETIDFLADYEYQNYFETLEQSHFLLGAFGRPYNP